MHFLKQVVLLSSMILLMTACKKSVSGEGGGTTPPTDTTVTIVTPTDPEIAKTIGFFLDDWSAKTFTAPAYTDGTVPAAAAATITVDASTILTKIPPTLFGNNANLWMGNFTDATLLSHIADQHPGIIRFPGGSISDVFFWNGEKNIKPSNAPDNLLNADGVSSSAGYWRRCTSSRPTTNAPCCSTRKAVCFLFQNHRR